MGEGKGVGVANGAVGADAGMVVAIRVAISVGVVPGDEVPTSAGVFGASELLLHPKLRTDQSKNKATEVTRIEKLRKDRPDGRVRGVATKSQTAISLWG